MTAADRLVEALAPHHVKSFRNGYRAKCPTHDGQSNNSLSITPTEGQALLHCFGGCEPADVLATLNMTLADLYDEPRVGVRYTYTDRAGAPTRYVHRNPPHKKSKFTQSGDTKAQPQLYRLPRVLKAVEAGATVYVVEGEKDVHAVESLGAVATTSPMGATNWPKVDVTPLTGAHVIVVPDRDEAGDRYLRDVLASLEGRAASIRVARAKVGKDAADHIAACHFLEELVEEPVPQSDTAGHLAEAFQRAVDREAHALRVREEAARIVRQERAGALDEPSLVSLTDLLAVEDEPVQHRVAGLWPVGGRVVLAAQYKAGKTTARNNLVRSLVDGDPFLDHFPVEPFTGRVVIIDNELDERMLRRWLRDQGIRNTGRVDVLALRGKVSTFDLLDPDCRLRWAAKIRQAQGTIVLFDCLRPVLDALGLSEDKDAGRFLVAFDALLHEAGASEGLVVHHMGHSGERSRGDTRIRDWPDVEWKLVRDKDDQGAQDGDSRQVYFSAFGRDVDSPEGLLAYDPDTRRLRLAGGTRKQTAADSVIPDVLAYLAENLGASQRGVEAALGSTHKRADVRTALRRAVEQGQVDTVQGPRRAVLHFLATPECASAPSAPEVRQRSSDECASAPLGGARALTASDDPVRHGALECECGWQLSPGEHFQSCDLLAHAS